MATSSSWRSNNGPRWSQGAANNNNHQSGGGGGGGGANVPRSASNNNIRPGVGAAAPASGAFPPLGVKGSAPSLNEAEAVQHDRMMYLIIGLVGNTVVATTKSGAKYVGILSSTSVPGDDSESMGVVLSSAQLVLKEGGVGPLKKMLIIKGEDLDSFSAKDVGLDAPVSMASANRAGFRTDTEISKKVLEPFGEGRMLQKWADDPDSLPLESDGAFGDASGGTSTGGLGGWDQFAANEARFGVKSNYEETLYTTKLDKSSKDYKDREKKAEQLAKEIMNSSTNNIHIAEERNLTGEGEEGQTEEDRYGAVVRGPNAYVPPAARRAAAAAAAAGAQNTIKANGAAREDKANGTQASPQSQIPTITSTPASNPIPDGTTNSAQPAPDAVGDFRQFVTSERERMEKKKAALAKKEKDSRLADLKNWGDKFKLKFPVSTDGSMATKDGGSVLEKPRDPSLQKSMSPTTAHVQQQAKAAEEGGANGGTTSVVPSPKGGAAKAVDGETNFAATTKVEDKARLAETKTMLAKMTIPKIPPFNAEKARARLNEAAGLTTTTAAAGQTPPTTASLLPNSASASKSSFKLSAKASSFKPFNPNAAAFTPGGAAIPPTPATASIASPRIPSETPSSYASPNASTAKLVPTVAAAAAAQANPTSSSPVRPFFGNRVLKKSLTPLHVREDFNPFKNGKVPESQTIGPTWGFTGKGHRSLFHAIPVEEGSNNGGNGSNVALHPSQQLPPPPPPPSMAPVHNMVSMGMHPHAGMGQQQGPPTTVPPPHMHQQHGQAGMTPNNGQPFYVPYGAAAAQGGAYRFPGGQQPMQQMPGNYGQMPPHHYLPFSPPMPPGGPPVYSPQMGNMFPPGASMHSMGVPPGQMPPPRNGGPGMQGKVPPHLYYPNAPFPPNPAGPPGAMSPIIRHQQQQQQQPPQQQQQGPPPPLPQTQSQGHHSNTASRAGSTAG